MSQHFQTILNQDTVLIRQTNHICNGSDSNQIKQFHLYFFQKCTSQLESHSTTSQIFKRIIRIWMFRVNDGIGIRQGFRHGMVVSHNDIYSHRLSQFNSLMTSNPIIHRHNQGNSFLLNKVFIDTSIRTIAIGKTIG